MRKNFEKFFPVILLNNDDLMRQKYVSPNLTSILIAILQSMKLICVVALNFRVKYIVGKGQIRNLNNFKYIFIFEKYGHFCVCSKDF